MHNFLRGWPWLPHCSQPGLQAHRRKREEGNWREGREIVVGPDKRIYVDIEAFQKWVRGLQ